MNIICITGKGCVGNLIDSFVNLGVPFNFYEVMTSEKHPHVAALTKSASLTGLTVIVKDDVSISRKEGLGRFILSLNEQDFGSMSLVAFGR